MMKKHTIFICACRNNPTVKEFGLISDTIDYQLAEALKAKIVDEDTDVYIKDPTETQNEQDSSTLSEARILIVLCTEKGYLDNSKDIISDFIKEANTSASEKVKKIIYVCVKSCGTLTKKDFDLKSSGNYLAESYELASDNLNHFVDEIHQYFFRSHFNKKAASVRQILQEYRSVLADSQTDHPITRHWLDGKMDKWVISPGRNRVLWLQGEHGSGKTIYIGDYINRMQNVLGKGVYYCKSSNTKTQNCERIVKAIACELCDAVPEYSLEIEQYVHSDRFLKHSANELFLELIISPFRRISIHNNTKNFFFAIDAIDELETNKVNVLDDFLNLLYSNIEHMPSFIYLIVTSPKNTQIYDFMQMIGHRVIELDSEKYKKEVEADAKAYLEKELNDLEIEYEDNQINLVLEKSENNFDYLHYFIKQCADMNQLPNPRELPRGLKQQFQYDFRTRFQISFYNEQIKPILQVLSDAYVPLKIDDISQILQIELSKINRIVNGQLSQFLRFEKDEKNEETISLYNRSLELWLNDTTHSFCLVQNNRAKEIIDWMKRKGVGFYSNEYLRKYGIMHLWECDEKKYIINTLIINSDENSFEKIKDELAELFVDLIKKDESSDGLTSSLIDFYSTYYSATNRIRDILVYSYRFLSSHIEKQNLYMHLKSISDLLKENHEEVRAKLLEDETIDDYEQAKRSLGSTIKYAETIASNNNDEFHSEWWNKRMLGIAYNRLAHLEAGHGDIDEAIKQYSNGKKNFDEALKVLARYENMQGFREKTKQDKKTLERDEAIINERMGDLYCLKNDFTTGESFYQDYLVYCKKAIKTNELKAMWDYSTCLLRLGDCKRYLGNLEEAYFKYREALFTRKNILQLLRNDCYERVFTIKHRIFFPFDCPEHVDLGTKIEVDEVPKESRDIDPIRDIGMCYVRLGDLAYFLKLYKIAEKYYDVYYLFCEISLSEAKTKATERDMNLYSLRQSRFTT